MPTKNGHSLLQPPTSWARVVTVVLADAAVLTLMLLAFAWPAASTAPRDVPLVVAGPAPAVAQVQERLDTAQPGAFTVAVVADERAARTAVLDREAYGAVVLSPSEAPTLLVASAASPAVAQLLTQAASGLGDQPAVQVQDVAPSPADDPRGAGLAAGALPLALGGVAAAALLTLTVHGLGRRLVAATGLVALTGPALVAVLHGGLGALEGNPLLEAAVVSTGLAATVFALVGLHALLGRPALVVGALSIVLIGNPLSAASTAPEMLPRGWGDLGQLLPPGAVVSALRAVSGFDGRGALAPVTVLGAWVLLGLGLAAVAAVLARRAGDEGRTEPPATPRRTLPVDLPA